MGIAGLICKVVGVLYLIPLANLVGSHGLGVYNQVFPSYNLMLTISSAGIPVAISRMVAARVMRGQAKNPNRVFRAALLILTVLGLLSTLVMMLFSRRFAEATGTPESVHGFLMIAPSLLLVCMMSAFRGFMQGRRRMWPTAISQLIEQVGKVGVALPLAYSFMQNGGYAMGVAGALLGTSIAEAVALLYMAVDYFFLRPKLLPAIAADQHPVEPYKSIVKELVYTAIPITIGACIVPLAGAIDSFMLVKLMKVYLPEDVALSNYGIYAGLVISLINVPTALAMAMSSNLVPAISGKRAAGDTEGIKRDAAAGLRLAMVVGLPSSVGMSLLSYPILRLLFHSKYTLDQLRLGSELLNISALTIVVFTLVQATSGILQGLYKQRIPMYTLFLGVLVKVGINYTAVQIPQINIYGAPWASLTCYVISAGLNLYYVAKYTKMKLSLSELLLRPGLATIAMALPVYLISVWQGERLGTSWLFMGLVILLAVAVYFVAGLKTKAIKAEDLPARLRRK